MTKIEYEQTEEYIGNQLHPKHSYHIRPRSVKQDEPTSKKTYGKYEPGEIAIKSEDDSHEHNQSK